jgi:uncharacterized membrane protein
MNNKRYKDLLAAGILLGVVLVPVFVWLFAKYASEEVKENILIGILSFLCLVLIFVTWKAIRLLID